MSDFSIDFFRDEVRNGFFIPTVIKQAWAAQIKVLEVIDNICKKHDITYFADWGTFLGTVRHGGYVPWDDDMDICMKRQDYIKFKEAAKTELPEHFCIHDYEHQENHWLFLSRVANSEHINYTPEHLNEFYNFPYMAGVDIFVLDYVYKDKEKEKERCKEVKHIIAVADMIVEGKIKPQAKEEHLLQFEKRYNKSIDRSLDARHIGIELYRLAEEQMSRVPEKASDSLVQLFPWGLKGKKAQPKKYYEKTVRLPFENTTMPVPVDYHRMLSDRYTDYFKIYKVWDGHDYPYFEGQRANLQAIADFKLPEFTFDKSMLRQNGDCTGNMDTMQKIVKEALADLEKLNTSVCDILLSSNIAKNKAVQALDILVQCQTVAIDLGNYIEQMKGTENISVKNTILSLEAYCEGIFKLYTCLSQPLQNQDMQAGQEILINDECIGLKMQLEQSFIVMKEMLQKEIIMKKLVVFLADNPHRWSELKQLYEYYCRQPDTEVYVTPLPVFKKNMYGEILASREELAENDRKSEYPDDINIISWDNANISAYEFEAIVIQNPYDGENPYLTVPLEYYAKELQKCTNCLIYQLPLGVNDFREKDITDIYGLKYSLAMPGAMYADKILTESYRMKEFFADYLTDFAKGTQKSVWQDKLMTIDEFTGELPLIQQAPVKEASETKKNILYCIGESEFFENAERAMAKIKERIELMTRYSEKIKTYVCLYPSDISMWSVCTEEERNTLIDLIKGYGKGGKLEFADDLDMKITEFDAYYGSASPFVCRFTQRHKPVMISE